MNLENIKIGDKVKIPNTDEARELLEEFLTPTKFLGEEGVVEKINIPSAPSSVKVNIGREINGWTSWWVPINPLCLEVVEGGKK